MVESLAFSGARLGEATNVLWKDVDFEKGIIRITDAISEPDQIKILLHLGTAPTALVSEGWEVRSNSEPADSTPEVASLCSQQARASARRWGSMISQRFSRGTMVVERK